MESNNIVVLGAGLTGISFAYHFDNSVPVFEKNSQAGGFVRTIDVNGYKFDFAPHLLHLHTKYVRDLIINRFKVPMEIHMRKAKIYFEGKIIDYPFELNLHAVSDKVKEDCLHGLSEVDEKSRADENELRMGSYKDYAIKAFGRGIAHHYLLPYNRKVWDTDPSDMTCEWLHFLPTADIKNIIKNSKYSNNQKFGYNTEFFYPHKCGIQELSDSFARRVSSIHLNEEVCEVNTSNKVISFVSGRQVRYKTLISTMPLKKLVDISDLSKHKQLAYELKNTSVYNINFVVKGEVPNKVHWLYFPEPNFEFYRLSFPKSYYQQSTPMDEQIISAEVASTNPNLDIEKIRDRIRDKLYTMNIFKIDDIVLTHCTKLDIAYCIYDKKRTEIVKLLKTKLDSLGIKSVGRYGQWEYSCMEDAILQGRTLALELRN